MNRWNSAQGRSRAAAALLVATASIGVCFPRLGIGIAAEDAAPEEFTFRIYDGFDGKSGLNWNPVRHDLTHVSFSRHPGKLTITTQIGTIHEDAEGREEQSARNLYLIDNPLTKDADFVITTCINSFLPEHAYRQAGLMCYDDDDNYLKWSYQFNWRGRKGQTFELLRESRGKSLKRHEPSPQGAQDVWLRLTKRGEAYEFATSADGKVYQIHGTENWGDGRPARFGIYAKNGGQAGVPEIDACFDFFEVRSPPNPPQKPQ